MQADSLILNAPLVLGLSPPQNAFFLLPILLAMWAAVHVGFAACAFVLGRVFRKRSHRIAAALYAIALAFLIAPTFAIVATAPMSAQLGETGPIHTMPPLFDSHWLAYSVAWLFTVAIGYALLGRRRNRNETGTRSRASG